MIVGVPKETAAGEARVALIPELVPSYLKRGFKVLVEAGAGERSGCGDAAYTAAGATVTDGASVRAKADVLLRIATPTPEEVDDLRPESTLLGFLWPLQNHALVRKLAARKVTSFSLDAVPRITRAQSMDALSAMSTIAGYKAVLVGAAHLPKMFPMLTTAAGTVRPAKVLILGAGVAGLMAIGTAKRLGAIVEAFDVRAAAKEQVLSLGAKFLEIGIQAEQDKNGYAKGLSDDQLQRQQQLLLDAAAHTDLIITTALVPGKRAPVLVTDKMLQAMPLGSVTVDLAAAQGGNVEGTEPDRVVVKHGVTLLGPTNLPATVPVDASQMLARVIMTLLFELSTKDGNVQVDLGNDVTRGCAITHRGEVLHEATRAAMGSPV